MWNFSLKFTLIVGIIGLLNFTHFDLGSNTSLNNSLATENTESQEATLIEDASNPDSTQSKEIYTVQKANTNLNSNLAATDSFDPDAIPYFRTETSTYSAYASSITINNHWNSTIKVVFTWTDGSIYSQTTIDPASSKNFNISNETVDLTISASDKDDFREWDDIDRAFIETYGESQSQFASFVHIPDMRYFTTDSSGTQVGNYFFQSFFHSSLATSLPPNSFNTSSITTVGNNFFANFAQSSSLTSLPAGSFNTSSITSVGTWFFSGFAFASALTSLPDNSFNTSSFTTAPEGFFNTFAGSSSLTSLPVGSFDTSHITTVGDDFFSHFNDSGSLTALPVNSFNTSSITTVGKNFFASFNSNGSLTALPPNSFNTSSITSVGDHFFSYFNESGQITKNTSTGISIMNPTDGTVTFYYPDGSDDIPSGGIFSFYEAYPPVFILSFDSTGGSEVSSITAQQGYKFTKPDNPTKSGYEFTEWVRQNGTSYNWNDTASGNLTLYASWTSNGSPTITNISPKEVQNGKVSTVTITGAYLDDPSYSFGITSTRFGDSSLPIASKIYNKVFPTTSISGRTATSATLKIPSVNWVGTYTISLLIGEAVPTKTVLLYQLPLGPAKSFTDISKLSSIRHANVKWLAQTGVTDRCNSAGTKYCPEDPVNRGSMAVFLQLLAGYPAGTSNTSSFADVFAGSSKTVTYVSGSKTTKEKVSDLTEKQVAAVNWLSLTGITGGSGSAKVNEKIIPTYRPQDVVNRGAMASFMLRFSEDVASTITTDGGTGFADVKIGSGNFTFTYKGAKKAEKVAKVTPARATAIRWMYDWGITGGSGTDMKGNLTYRAQDAVNRGSMATFMKNLAVYMGFTP